MNFTNRILNKKTQIDYKKVGYKKILFIKRGPSWNIIYLKNELKNCRNKKIKGFGLSEFR